ncbi:MAG: hypothetical protein ABIJ05_04970 [Patescibacteria group bacterium]
METSLMEKDYKEHPRTQIRYIGETEAAIRFVDTEDREDINRMFDIASNKTVQSFVDDLDGMTIGDIQKWADRHKIKNSKDWEVLYVVSGSPEYVKKEEVGEIQGFVNCYSNQETRDEVKEFKVLLPNINSKTQLVELSIAKRSQSKPGQISSAVRQVCLELNKLKGKDIFSPEMLIFVYVKTLNNAGKEVFKRACFENRGKVNLKGEKDDYYLFTLNWDKLNSLVHSNSDKVQFTSVK